MIDFQEIILARRAILLAEAEQARLAAQLPRKRRGMRLELAIVQSLFGRNQQPQRYSRTQETGREDWVWSSVSA